MELFATKSGEVGIVLVTIAVLLIKYIVLFGTVYCLYKSGAFQTQDPEKITTGEGQFERGEQ